MKLNKILATLSKHERARIGVQLILYCEGEKVGEFKGDFFAIIH